MTRTERNQYPAALLKDRRSRSGLSNQSETQRKGGAGAHNWGSYQQEGELEAAADQDARQEQDMFELDEDAVGGNDKLTPLKPHGQGNGELETAGMDNKDIQRDVIATSPTDSMASIDSAQGKGRRMSNVSDEERERARIYREGVMGKGGIDLAHIAKTSYGIAQSPPNTSFLGASPNQTKNAFAMKQ